MRCRTSRALHRPGTAAARRVGWSWRKRGGLTPRQGQDLVATSVESDGRRPAHHDARRLRPPRRLLPRAVRSGEELDRHRQGAHRGPPRAAGRHARPRAVALERPVRLPRRPPTRSPSCCRADDPVALVGHSMGGKIAMVVALRHPELVERLCVVDVAPVGVRQHAPSSRATSRRCRALDLDALERRSDADAALREAVPDDDGARLPAPEPPPPRRGVGLAAEPGAAGPGPAEISGWPEDRLEARAPYDGPVLWVNGAAVGLRPPGARRGDGPLVPPQPPGHRQGRRPLGALRAAAGVRRGAAAGSCAERQSRRARGRPRRRCGCRRWSSRTGASGCGTGRARCPRSRRRRRSPSRDISSARITSIIAIAVSTTIRVASGASGETAWMCQSNGVVAHQLGDRLALVEHRVDELDGVVAVAGEQLAQPRPRARARRRARRGRGRGGRCSRTRPRTRRGRRSSSACRAPAPELASATAAWSATSVSWAKTTLTCYAIAA